MAHDLPPEAVEAARQATGRCLGLTHSPAELIGLALAAAAPHIAAAERARIRLAATDASFTLFRPGNGPAHGMSLEVVPLAELLTALGETP